MLSLLKAKLGNQVVLELVTGRQLCGTLLDVKDNVIQVETSEGIATMSVSSVQMIWENLKRSLADEDMEQIVDKLRSNPILQYVCPALHICPVTYGCIGQHSCANIICRPGGFTDYTGGPAPCVSAFYGYRSDSEPPSASSSDEEQSCSDSSCSSDCSCKDTETKE